MVFSFLVPLTSMVSPHWLAALLLRAHIHHEPLRLWLQRGLGLKSARLQLAWARRAVSEVQTPQAQGHLAAPMVKGISKTYILFGVVFPDSVTEVLLPPCSPYLMCVQCSVKE